jgi:precorrin-2 dehydrogenase/sirohydrochlorin ferrochelatase
MKQYPYFPMFIDISGRHFLVAGAGKIALRRVKTLLPFGCTVTVIAPEADPGFEELLTELSKDAQPGEKSRLTYLRKKFEAADLETEAPDYVIAATSDAAVNAGITEQAKTRGIPVNNSADRTQCDFYFPGIARKDNLVIGVCASGEDHKKAKQITEEIREKILDTREKETACWKDPED